MTTLVHEEIWEMITMSERWVIVNEPWQSVADQAELLERQVEISVESPHQSAAAPSDQTHHHLYHFIKTPPQTADALQCFMHYNNNSQLRCNHSVCWTVPQFPSSAVLAQRVTEVSGKNREGSFLLQQLSVLIRRFNAVSLHDCFVDEVPSHSR